MAPIISLCDDKLIFCMENGYLTFRYNYSTQVFITTIKPPLNVWSHIVWQRTNSNTFTMFINGIQQQIALKELEKEQASINPYSDQQLTINDTIQEQFTPSFFEFMMQNLLLIIAINYSRTATTSKCNTN